MSHLTQFWDDGVKAWDQNFTILRTQFHKQISNLKVPFKFDFRISIRITAWDTSWVPFWANVGLTKSPSWIKTSKFWQNGFINKLPFSFDCHLFNLYLFYPFSGWWRHHGDSKLQILNEWFKKQIIQLKFPFRINLHLSPSSIGTWDASFGPFWPDFRLMKPPGDSKL